MPSPSPSPLNVAMPLVPFDSLPHDARLWIFAAARALSEREDEALRRDVHAYLSQWQAHGHPLTCGADWRDGRFFAVAVDQSTAGASGCSIDSLYRILHDVQRSLGTTLMPGPLVFYRDAEGVVQGVDRETFRTLRHEGAIGPATPVFDTTLTDAGSYRQRFELPLERSWHARLAR